MPRKPTSHAVAAEDELRRLAAEAGEGPLPTVRELGERLAVSYATISRILQRLSQEAVVWQHPNGRFYPSAAEQQVTGFPIVIIGRQIQNWSILYQEILEGVSEVCTARGCPLVFLSSAKLVRHENPEQPPTFIPLVQQKAELTRLLAAVPRPCGGVILDHLWEDKLAGMAAGAFRNTAMLLRTSRALETQRGSLDLAAGAEMMLAHLSGEGYRHVIAARPFDGDPAIEATLKALQDTAKAHPFASCRVADCTTPEARRKLVQSLKQRGERVAIVSPEDHVATLLWQELQKAKIPCPARAGLASLQGTSAVTAPVTRLRHDYRALGRELVSALLAGNMAWKPVRPLLVRGRTTAAN